MSITRYCGLSVLLAGLCSISHLVVADTKLEYNRDIRPILAENCFACHGPDSAARQADLRLDKRDLAVEMTAIVPGEPDSSEILNRITSDDPEMVMPPPSTRKSLTDDQKEKLRQWIAEGAEYEVHWSLIPPRRPAAPDVHHISWSLRSQFRPGIVPDQVPDVKVTGKQWVRNDIDRFVLARLAAAQLSPAPEADRRTLARRVSLDLTGLPPAPELVEDFVSDPSDDAYERLVDRLLEQKSWGEHQARYWLDVARYADTHGIHFDNYREIWAYRDWVIDAFNQNMPFDQFTIEQLAGDLLPNATMEQKIASGFNRCNITTNEGGVIPEEYLVLYTRDRTETVGHTWLGMTINCAVCHEHKFDPFSQREFYELAAFFNNTTQGAMDGNIPDTPPVLPIPRKADRARYDEVNREISVARAGVDAQKQASRPEFETWLSTADASQFTRDLPSEALHVHASLSEGQGKSIKVAVDGEERELKIAESANWQEGPSGGAAIAPQGSLFELSGAADFDSNQAFTCSAWLKLPSNDSAGAICARMDNTNSYRGWDFWCQRRQVGMHIIHRWSDNAVKVVGKEPIPGNQWTHVTVTYDGSRKAAGIRVYYNGRPQDVLVEADRLSDTTRTAVPFKVGQRHSSDVLSGAAIQDLRIYARSLSESEVLALANSTQFGQVLAKAPADRTDAEKDLLYSWWLGKHDQRFKQLSEELRILEKEQADLLARGTQAHVMNERNEEAMAYVLFRGEYDQRRDAVKPKTPSMLPPMPEDLPQNRLGLAQWLLLPEQPLTARVTVNRFWQQLFGTGIVRTSGDFGVAGELPSHPELLDWLAVEFRDSGWDVKRLFKLMVTSATYRQAAIATDEKLEGDPDNRLLSRGPRFRMDAEMVRDYALAASELLVDRVGGPSVKPYQPPGVGCQKL
jgi:hypothetical protein